MSAEQISLETLTPTTLLKSGNPNCLGCWELRHFASEVIDEIPAIEEISSETIVARFAIWSANCKRSEPIPAPKCEGGMCGVDSRQCIHSDLSNMSIEDRLQKAKEIAGAEITL